MLIGSFCIKTPDTYTDKTKTTVRVPGEERILVLKPGDGVIIRVANVRIGVLLCQHHDVERETSFFVGRRNNIIIIKFSSTMFSRMDNVLIVHGIRQDNEYFSGR